MAPPHAIDRDALHRYLWRRTDRRGCLRLVQSKVATELGISPYHFSRIVAEFMEQGRLTQISIGRHNHRTYVVADPALFSVAV